MRLPKSHAIAPTTKPLQPEAFAQSSATTVWWLSGAGFLINSRGTLIMIDPVISMQSGSAEISEIGLRMRVPLPIESKDVPRLDAVLYTHADNDHVGTLTPKTLVKPYTMFAGTAPVVRSLKTLGVPTGQTLVLQIGEKFRIGQIEIMVTPADHPWQLKDTAKNGDPWGPEDCCGFLIRTPDGTVWCTGDTRLLPEHLQMTGIDLLLLDISRDEYHLGPADAIRLANKLKPAHLIPYHYGTYDAPDKEALNGDPAEIAREIEDSESRLHVLAPGEKFVLKKVFHS